MNENENDSFKCRFCNFEIADLTLYGFKWDDIDFCPNCGQPQINYCINGSCELNNELAIADDLWAIVPFDFKFCHKCGEKTELYDFLLSQEKNASSHKKDNN